MVRFDNYTGPTLADQTVPIIRRTWSTSGSNCSRLQIPLKLAWAVTIHKSQGLTLDKIVIDIGRKEFSSGLTYVACSRVRCLKHLLFSMPFAYQRLSNLSKSQRLQERIREDCHLQSIQQSLISVAEEQPSPDTMTLSPPPLSELSRTVTLSPYMLSELSHTMTMSPPALSTELSHDTMTTSPPTLSHTTPHHGVDTMTPSPTPSQSPPPSQPTPSAPNLPDWIDNDGLSYACVYINS